MDNPYKTLGVAHDASQDAIRQAYRKLAKKHHPDLNPGDAKAEEQFKKVAAANGLLSDPEKRGQFDRGEIDAAGQERAQRPSYRDHADGDPGRRYSPGAQESWDSGDFSDIFGSIFRNGRRPGGAFRSAGNDERYSLTTDFLEAINGATRRINLPDGRMLDVKIPAGTVDGLVMRLRGQGGAGINGGAAGDALIEIHVAPHPFFERSGQDIKIVLPVSLAEAVLGGPVEVKTPRGPVKLQVPAGSDSGTELRLRGRGVPQSKGHAAGDLYATLRVMIGKPDAALTNFLRDWKPENSVNPRAKMETAA
ncbi:DnaJ C-terminal domain-containing protein [Sphingobium sp. D43FB]|uniref:DnaJ C-terminal domain-containing protein n=1 Tax=Sphingobium sp. D43FB TaxID=2017595 RepID=UPI000BB53F3D|nr:DnaJ C-terminal domain-containing protein [Sphingobium sp. D43FB]PBN43599.1 molecular chaperone DnaJ [Sphingobium sp. D43FB]